MNKTQLIEAVSVHGSLSKAEVSRTIEALMDVISAAMEEGERVTLSGFGTFYVTTKQGRVGRNPRTGQSIRIAPKRVAKFRSGIELSETV